MCRALKDEPATRAIPVIFLTGKSEPQSQVEGLELGAVDYITKTGPTPRCCRARVRMHLALANRRAELERLVQERTEQLERTRVELIKRLARVHGAPREPGGRQPRDAPRALRQADRAGRGRPA